MSPTVALRRKIFSAIVVTSVAVAGLVVGQASASASAAADAAPPAAVSPGLAPVIPPTPGTVTSDALPTVQIDGVVWSQAVVGNTVYAGGSFANARPAGAAPGTNQTPRANLLAYDIRTGNLIASFNPILNAQVRVVAASPDGSRIYVGGDFTQANGVNRYRIAAYSTATGALIATFAPVLNYKVGAIVATNSTVYVGGSFTSATNNQTRNRLAAFSAANGALLGWNPSADAQVNALVLTPDGTRVIAGGAFATINGVQARGLASLDATSGTLLSWAAGSVIQDWGTQAAILGLTTDGTNIYGNGYVFGANGNLEGAFAADPDSGTIKWIEDCHGDTYSAFPTNGVLYTVSHAHYCGNVGGFPQSTPWSVNSRHALAFTTNAVGTLGSNTLGYHNFGGNPSPSMINWFPDLATGTFTGANQAAWSVSGNSTYVVLGGEFPKVNNIGQQGLVRFATKPTAPSKDGPRLSGANFLPTLVVTGSGTVRAAWQANYDRDDMSLTYSLVRDSDAAHPVYTTTISSTYWNTPSMGYFDSGLTPGQTYKYRLYATDPSGNQVVGDNVSITVPATSTQSDYSKKVIADGATDYWPLDEPSGTLAYDYAGFSDVDLASGVSRGAAGPIAPATASTFDGTSNGTSASRSMVSGPTTFTASAWFRTTTTSGGKILGFGNQQTTASTGYDRQIYMDNAGRVLFGVCSSTCPATVQSAKTYNDGSWHLASASLGAGGLNLYVDGLLVGHRSDITTGQALSGYWRIGGDNTGGWTNAPSSNYFAGDISNVAIFPTVLSKSSVQAEFQSSGRIIPKPSDPYGLAVYNDSPTVFLRLNEASGTLANDSSGSGADGTYFGGETLGAASPVTGPAGSAVAFNGIDGTVSTNVAVPGPSTYSEEIWFNTTTSQGGKLIGFGNAPSGRSSNYDRHVYMQNNGQLTFGTYTGQMNTATSSHSYNDGQWHYLVASQGADGMKLYVDNALVATNPQTSAQAYSGYWRIGGDTSWGGSSAFFNGTLDEAAIYPVVLTPSQIAAHYAASPAGSGTANTPPTAAFTQSASGLTVATDASSSTDSEGPIASYAWTFGDGASATGRTASHDYAVAGSYTVTLQVTDAGGLTDVVSHPISVVAANTAPTAAFTTAITDLAVTSDGSTSSDQEGPIAAYQWTFGDGGTASTSTASHTYGAAGTYTITLQVTDNQGATNSVSHTVTVTAPNQAPTAAFVSTTAGLTASLDGSTSSDSDGSVASYAWTFGDGGSATGATTSHAYGAAGTYQVTLTVTDNGGLTAAITNPVTVTAPAPGTVATDTFDRTVAGGLGSATVGGAWTVSGAASNFYTNGAVGNIKMATAGSGPAAFLNSVSAQNVDVTVDAMIDQVATGGGTQVSVAARHIGTSDYRVKAKWNVGGAVTLSLTKVVAGTETTVKAVTVSGLSATAGDTLRIRLQVSGNGTTTLNGKVWNAAAAEPAAFQVSTTDTTAALQAAGSIGVIAYLSSTATSAPVVASIDNLSASSSPVN